jgi:pimeloyl-ACP methyl ester carboxylesterase
MNVRSTIRASNPTLTNGDPMNTAAADRGDGGTAADETGHAPSVEEAPARVEPPAWVDRRAYPFRSRWIELPRGDRMHYVDEGPGAGEHQAPAILFVHGTPTWSFEWRRLIEALRPTFRCVAPDHLGFGLSDRPADGGYTPEWHARNLADFVERLGLRDVTLVVHDFGGPIGLPLALDGSGRVRRLVVLNTFMWSLMGDKGVERAARLIGGPVGRFLYRRANFSLRVITPSAYADRRRFTPEVHRQYLAPFPDLWSREAVLWALARALLGSDAFYSSLWERRQALAALPALVVWGMKDPAFRPHQLARWREVLPQARVVELAVGHWPQEEAPDAVIRAVETFLGG